MSFDMNTLGAIINSFIVAIEPMMLVWIISGTIVGIIFGAAPGLTATTAVALFTPITFYMPMETSLAFLMGIYCGGYYAGSIPAILINTPGAPGNAATTMDGYPMARSGKAGEALGHSVLSSWVGGTLSAFALLFFAPMIGSFALKFGAAEYFSVAVLGLVCIAGVSGKCIIKGIAGALIGMILGLVGMDPIAGIPRFTFSNVNLMGGISLIPSLVGLFAITEVFTKLEAGDENEDNIISKISNKLPKLKLYWSNKWLLIKSSVVGVIIGAIPGTGPTIASWIAYNEAKSNSKHPEEFGKGSVEGIMACESSNNAVTGGALIPLLTLGVPGDTVTAVLLGALMIQGVAPGPTLVVENFELVALLLWLLIFANAVMLLCGILGVKVFPYILKIPMKILMPVVAVLCITGGYAVSNSFFDALLVVILGICGYGLLKLGFPIPPIVLGLILGPIIEPNMRRALLGSNLDYLVFFKTPISAALLIATVALFIIMRRKNKIS